MLEDYLKPQLKDIEQRINQAKQLLNDPDLESLARADIEELEKQKSELLDSVASPMFKVVDEDGNQFEEVNPDVATLEIRSAAGGDEAGLFASELLRMYLRFAEKMKWKIAELDRSEGGLGQIKSVVLQISGKGVYPLLRYESGVHRVQRVPKTESSGRIHTSTATVAVLPEVERSQIVINPEEVEFEAFRSGGAGGQNVNKVNTAVRLKHLPTGIVVSAQTERSQLQNRENALNLLRSKLWKMEQVQKASEISSNRALQVGSGERNEKIRTYNFSQNRVTDHRINKSWHNLEEILDGNLEPVLKALQANLHD